MEEKIRRLLKELIEIPTPTGKERRLFPLLTRLLAQRGFQVKIYTRKEISSLVGKREGGDLLISTHIDTFASFSNGNFYVLKGKNILKGRGVIDAKGQLASLLVALELTSHPCQVVITSDEEKKGRGSEIVPVQAQGAIVLEPTDFQICVAEAGSVEVKIEVKGKSAHGSVPEEGENAIIKAWRIYEKIKEIPSLKVSHPYFPEGGWVNVGKITGGYEPMIVPPSCTMEMDIGFVPTVSPRKILEEIKSTLKGNRIRITDISYPFEISPQERVVKILSKVTEQVRKRKAILGGMRSWTDAENFFRKGIPTVVFGAGKLALAHTERERVKLKDLSQLAEILKGVIEEWQ